MLRFDLRWGMAMALMVLVLATATAQAQTLYALDGIELSGTVRVVARGAGTCTVLEASHTEAVYERMKANHGQPLDVWRLDFSAYNGSGRPLSFLSAHFKVASEWPPCTTWSGPEGSYAKPVLWGGSFQVLQQPYGMEPGEEVSDTILLLVFHEHQPEFESWDVDFRFGAPAESVTRTDRAPTAAATRDGPPARNPSETAASARGAGARDRFRAELTCAGQPEGAACWMELADPPQCSVWNPDLLQPDVTTTWTGACSGGLAQGEGTLTWVWDSGKETSESTGRLQVGQMHGPWVERFASGTAEGPYVNGRQHGRWVMRWPSGTVRENTYVNGERQ